MDKQQTTPLVTTIKERCRVCYTCVRECPAKAIRIRSGQAEVMAERCIGCGNCVKVCSQHAKQVLNSIPDVESLVASGRKIAAIIAPSFPAEFIEADYTTLVGMIRALGFHYVNEVAFGADLVADRYFKLLSDEKSGRYIATNCPAKILYVEKYHPELVKSLAPIVSPMIATARALRKIYGDDLKVVFVGPCIAKKAEGRARNGSGEIDAVLTFLELRQMFEQKGIAADKVEPSNFDEPHGGDGALFPLSRGMLQAANITEDLMAGDIVVADGRVNFREAIKEFESGDLNARLLEVLVCNGCIMGPGISANLPLFQRRSRVSQYVRGRYHQLDHKRWREFMDKFADLDLSQKFYPDDQRIVDPSEEDITRVMNRMGKSSHEDELNCGACGYDTCREHAIAICREVAEGEMCLPNTIDQIKKTLKELAASNEQLASVQEALVQSEKLASMGQLAAGIAHEVNNPLGIVLMYAHLMLEEGQNDPKLKEDLDMIVEQTDRCKKIVAGLLNFARQNKVVRQPTDIRKLVARGLKSVQVPENVAVEVVHDVNNPEVEIDADQITQVLTNLIVNAIEAMPQGGKLSITTTSLNDHVNFVIKDTGIGVPQEIVSKIFEPFFTTKKLGKGTGLGLAVTYGIVKMHSGDITVESNTDPAAGPTGATFTVSLPRFGQKE